MGRIKNASDITMKHISHQHILELCNYQDIPINTTVCSGCKVKPSENMVYICKPCNYLLHVACAKFPERITHPSHPNHTLSLLTKPSYHNGKFKCDACNYQGDGFSYHCKVCNFDLHVVCASKPMEITHQMHKCRLGLTFENVYENSKGFNCDVCLNIGCNQWFYSCVKCRFDVHLGCTKAKTRPGLTIQNLVNVNQFQEVGSVQNSNLHNQFQAQVITNQGVHNSFPGVNLHNHFQASGSGSGYQNQIQAPIIANQGVNIMHYTSLGHTNHFQVPINANQGIGTSSPTFTNQFQAPINANQGINSLRPIHYMHSASMGATPNFQNQFQGPIMTNQLMHSASTGSMMNYQPPMANFQAFQNNQPSKTGGLMGAAMTGFTEGAANQVGTSLVQGVIGALFGAS